MNRHFLQFLDQLFLTRPVLLVPVWGFAAFGYWHGCNGDLRSITTFWISTPISVYLDIFIFSLSVGSVYILNQIADIEVDKKNGGLPLLASGKADKKAAWISVFSLLGISLLYSIFSGKISIAIFSIFTIILGFFYSFKPTSFSGRPILDFISNALGYGVIAFGSGWSLSGSTFQDITLFASKALPYFFLMCAGSISSTLPDRAGDIVEGKKTTAVVFGCQKSNLIATSFLFLSFIVSIILNDPIALTCTLIPLPIYIGYIFKPGVVLMEATYKIGGALCMICACVVLPFIFPSGIIVFFLTRLYFRLRHGVIYPSLVPVK